MTNPNLFWPQYPLPSTPLSSAYFSEKRYWQGPTWLNTNWLVIDGLTRYGFTAEAEHIRQASLQLVERSGMYEYFSPISGAGYGAENFSWTAACVLDLISKKT
jgi:glycogen debranching enzyme